MSEKRLLWTPKITLGSAWFFLAFGGSALIFLLFSPRKGLLEWLLAAICFFWTGGALFGVIHGLRTRVESDETGLRWRDWRGVWRAAKWDEISDFHKRWSQGANGSTHIVETARGNFDFGIEADGKAIAEIVALRAVNAPTREWAIKGERLIDAWPRRFEFYHAGLQGAARNCFFVFLAAMVGAVWLIKFRTPPRADLPFGSWFLAYAAPFLVIPILPALIWFFFAAALRQARPFRGQSVEVSPDGLVFDGATRLEATWSQIENWKWIRHGTSRFLQLQTASGSLEIPTFAAGFRSLCRILERFSGVPLVKAHGEEEMALHSIQTAPDGSLEFRFSIADGNLMMWLFPVLGLSLCFMPFLMHLADPQSPMRDQTPILVIGIGLLVGSVLFNFWMRSTYLRLTTEALEWRGPCVHRVVAWQNIESFGSRSDGTSWIVAQNRKISLSWLGVTVPQRSRLREEISKRAVNATGEWK